MDHARSNAAGISANGIDDAEELSKLQAISDLIEQQQRERSFVVRVETEGHVFLVVLPRVASERNYVYVVQSILLSCDSWVERNEGATLLEALDARVGYIKKLVVYSYEEEEVLRRLGVLLHSCFHRGSLGQPMTIANIPAGEAGGTGAAFTWSHVLNAVVDINSVSEHSKWNDPSTFFLPKQ